MTHSIIAEDSAEIGRRLGGDLSRLQGKTILVTGAAGFLCAYLSDILAVMNDTALDQPMKLVLADNFLRGTPERLAPLEGRPDVDLLAADVCQPLDLQGNVDFIIHGASIASPTFYRKYPLETIDVNVNGLRQMLELARTRDTESLINLSSSEVYGDPDPGAIPTPEDYRGIVSCTGPRACYDESKRLGETLSVAYHQAYGTPVKIIRPFNVYGPGQRLDDKRIVPDLMSAVIAKEPIVLFSDGRASRSFCYAADFIFGLLLVMLRGVDGEPYNVGNDTEMTIRQAAETAAGIASPPLPIELRVSEDAHYLTDNPNRRCPDLSKARALGYAPTVPLDEGLRRTLNSYAD